MEAHTAPRVSDFSEKAIKRVVVKEGFMHPLTLYIPTLGILGGLTGLLFNFPSLVTVMVIALVFGLANAMVHIFFRRETIGRRYIQLLKEKMKEHEKFVLVSLEKNLKVCFSIKDAERYARQGAEQFGRVQKKYQNVRDLLEQKLNSGELTFGRFSGAAEQVYLSALDNLKQVVATLQSAGTIDVDYVQSRLKELSSVTRLNEAEKKEMETLKKRLLLRESQFQKIGELLANNEEAMTELEETTAAIASMQTDEKFAVTNLENAITQLQELAQRAYVYNNK